MSRFLLVSLNIMAILRETTLHRRREKLGAMTNGTGLGDAYDATIGRIKAQEGDRARLGIAALMWVSHSWRPLKVDEICHALAVEIGSTDININNVPSIRTVLSCCQGLAAVDNGSSTIRLIHFTLKEYLSRHTDLFDRAHSKIAESCLTYLNFRAIKDLSASPSGGPHGTPLLTYASLHWGDHMRLEFSDRGKRLALELLENFDGHISGKLLWKRDLPHPSQYKPLPALHCIAYFGVAEVAVDVIRMKGSDVNQRDSVGRTPLMWAAAGGREKVVKLLLQYRHTKLDKLETGSGRTAFSYAAEKGSEGVVRLFLDRRFVDRGSMGRRWGKPLRAMSVLFGRKYINPDIPDNKGRTPLSWAAGRGHGGVVELLLAQEDVRPHMPDNGGWTPLFFAAENGHCGVVKLLLAQKDINPDRPDLTGLTPLSWAAWNGHDGVVKLLLEREDVIPDRPGDHGKKPASQTAGSGGDGVRSPLLAQEDVSPDRTRLAGQTPLSLAARNGHDGVVKLLLKRGDVSPDRPDNYGQTPLSLAACAGHDGVVKVLLEREEVDPDRPDNDGQTPLSWAAWNGHDGSVKLLLERQEVSPGRPDNYGRTPVSLAARNGHGGVVELLKARGAAAPVWYRSWRHDPSGLLD